MSVVEFSSARARVGGFLMRRVRVLSGPDQLRLLGAAFFLFLFADGLLGAGKGELLFSPFALVADLLAFAAMGLALWRPWVGGVVAVVPLAGALVTESTSSDAMLLMVVVASNLVVCKARTAIVLIVSVFGYAIARAVVYSGESENRPLLVTTLSIGVVLGIGIGSLLRFWHQRRVRSRQAREQAELERARIRQDEREQLAWELHDVVTHQLSTASLQVVGYQDTQDIAALKGALATVGQCCGSALTELRLLAKVLHNHPEVGELSDGVGRLKNRVLPTRAAAEACMLLERAGFEPTVDVPASADRLEMTLQATLVRVFDEATRNIVQHAKPSSPCQLSVRISETQVNMRIASALKSDLLSCVPEFKWGLAGLAARISLTLGSLSAGPVRDEWIVAVSLPRL